MFRGLHFETRTTAPRSAPARADVACFVGFAAPRSGQVPDAIIDQLVDQGWRAELVADGGGLRDRALPARPLPVMVENYTAFAALFETWRRAGELRWESPLSGAVRDFFRQGGRRAWIVPVGAQVLPEGDIEQSHLDGWLDALMPGAYAVVPKG